MFGAIYAGFNLIGLVIQLAVTPKLFERLGVGATLRDTGNASVFADTLVLEASGMPNSMAFFLGMRLYFEQSTPAIFGDGVGCVMSASLFRLGSKPIVGGVARFPEPGNTSLGVTAGMQAAYGSILYQVMYRNSAAAFCTPATANMSAGLVVHWTP